MTGTGPVVAGIDLSLTSTGVALTPGELHRIQSKGTRDDNLFTRRQRLCKIRDEVVDLASYAELVVIEQPAYSKTGGSQHDRSGLWWMTVEALSGLGRVVVEVPPTVRAKYATGKGNAGKDQVLAAVVRRYPDWDVSGNDVADALVLAAIGRRLLGEPIDDLPQAQVEVIHRVALPLSVTLR